MWLGLGSKSCTDRGVFRGSSLKLLICSRTERFLNLFRLWGPAKFLVSLQKSLSALPNLPSATPCCFVANKRIYSSPAARADPLMSTTSGFQTVFQIATFTGHAQVTWVNRAVSKILLWPRVRHWNRREPSNPRESLGKALGNAERGWGRHSVLAGTTDVQTFAITPLCTQILLPSASLARPGDGGEGLEPQNSSDGSAAKQPKAG